VDPDKDEIWYSYLMPVHSPRDCDRISPFDYDGMEGEFITLLVHRCCPQCGFRIADKNVGQALFVGPTNNGALTEIHGVGGVVGICSKCGEVLLEAQFDS
jgi:DNA-directed RNA polymerase subunit RPC12/RpoP